MHEIEIGAGSRELELVWGGGGGKKIKESLHTKMEILGHLYLYTTQKRYHSLEMALFHKSKR